jgi:endonuclease VIII
MPECVLRRYARGMPEGDSLRRAARRLQPLVGQRLEAESPHPRAAVTRVAERLDGLRLEGVEAVGKNLLLRFEGGVVLRSHLRMRGRWFVRPRGSPTFGRPWLVLRGERLEAIQVNGPVLELNNRAARTLGPDILERPPDLTTMVSRLRGQHPSREVGEALLDQRLVAGVGNMWKAEALWEARVSPWLPLGEAGDDQLRTVLDAAARMMRASVDGVRGGRSVYRRAGRPCLRCGEPIRSRGQGDDNRIAYWCPTCQPGERGVGRAEA